MGSVISIAKSAPLRNEMGSDWNSRLVSYNFSKKMFFFFYLACVDSVLISNIQSELLIFLTLHLKKKKEKKKRKTLQFISLIACFLYESFTGEGDGEGEED